MSHSSLPAASAPRRSPPDDRRGGVWDVLIVGAGPSGVGLANLLGKAGLSVLLIDRHPGVLQIPRAVHLDGETMRVIQSMGLAQAAMPVLRPGHSMHWVNAVGETLLVRLGQVGLGSQGWHNDYYFHQPDLEAVLRQGLARYPTVRLRERLELRGLSQDVEGVEAEAWDLDLGAPLRLRARWLVGCDGARSTVRRLIDAEDFEELGDAHTWLVVDGVLNHPLDLPEHTVQHCDPTRPATSIYVHPLRRRWEIMLRPGEDAQAMTEPERIWPLLARWVQPSQARLERASAYVFHARVARRWQDHRVLLAGDAAHQTPPFLGQGLCAALRDIANLAWKLAQAIQQPATGEALLATYAPERIPHVREFIALAVQVGEVIQELDPARAAERDHRLKAEGLQFPFPTPALGAGLHLAGEPDAAACVGKVAPQHTLPDGRWLDDVIGARWALLLRRGEALPPAAERAAQALGAAVLADGGDRIDTWLADQRLAAVILRPDRYVCDACSDLAALPARLEQLLVKLGSVAD
ncbi:bifunctional 3-(3-hydroxy-phenyl)propionate/3-hydroxycinnamic acid hydroxylase [Sphaerotilus microaerophilus]|uniref:3-(3-hydroxyphenyl)propionate hydroxylase n=1 Tax=Sphaerotilus microaerophilus TaxID=2914710 RepID=A0ABM7YMC5_9BURK|nr:bifunctional 3-(3-hydroxy-phenyl)propionate/3-hydroxycinnamic acid hydroxylase [Sphaerotilus sp. FB-5]BDI05623.1 3-(3-hydroxyphenyl)propionate hydroxylase [Sphaerotilus sp. FB-5]